MPGAGIRRGLGIWLALLLVAQVGALTTVADRPTSERAVVLRALAPTSSSSTTSAVPPSTMPPTTAPPSTTTAPSTTAPSIVPPSPTSLPPPPPTTVAPAPPSPPPTAGRACCAHWTLDPYRGVGAWVDVYDWTLTATGGRPSVTVDDIDDMARAGVQTLFLQTAQTKGDADLIEPDRFRRLAAAAHAEGLAVVGWYLPDLVDPDKDVRRLVAAAGLPVDGLSVNIEATDVADHAERSRRIVEVSRRVRAAIPDGVLGTVHVGPVGLQNAEDFWRGFPWEGLDPYYDVWQPMAYVSYRYDHEPMRDAELYTRRTIEEMRELVGDEPLSIATGVADGLDVDDVDGFVRASVEGAAVGGSIYDWATASPGMWSAMEPLAR